MNRKTLCTQTLNLGRVMRKLAYCICKNKGADYLRSKCAADQRLCFRYIDTCSTIPLLSKCKAISCGCTARVLSDLVGNPKTIFSLRGSFFRTCALYLCKKIRSRFLLHKNNVHLKSVHHFLCEISSSYTKNNGHLTVHSRKIMDSFTIG